MVQILLFAVRIVGVLSKASKITTIFATAKNAKMGANVLKPFINLMNIKNANTINSLKSSVSNFSKNLGVSNIKNILALQKRISKNGIRELLKDNKFIKEFLNSEIRKHIPSLNKYFDANNINMSNIKNSDLEAFFSGDEKESKSKSNKSTNKWKYLTRDKRSDFAIHSIRYRFRENKSYSDLDVRFFTIKNGSFFLRKKVYTFTNVPTVLITIMILIKLGAILPSGYRAGALHFFLKTYWKPFATSLSKSKFRTKNIRNRNNFLRNRSNKRRK